MHEYSDEPHDALDGVCNDFTLTRICKTNQRGINEQSTLHNPKEPLYDVPDGSISFKHVTFRYSDTAETPVLSDINLDIKSGETIGIIGGTGSSKSSLVNLISRLYDTDTGSVIVGGHDVREYDMDTLRNKVAVVLQQNVLFSGTILENLRWGDKTLPQMSVLRPVNGMRR